MRTLILASGGLDSALLAGMHPSGTHLWINYGQVNFEQERRASLHIAQHYRAAHYAAKVTLSSLARSSVTTKDRGFLTGPSTVVPNRNAILISMGVAAALEHNCTHVLIGCNLSDEGTYFDCRPAFIAAMDEVARQATGDQVRVGAPLLLMSKREIGDRARALGVPVDETWSCYAPQPAGWGQSEPCRSCNACYGREEALGVHHR